jgi:predicted nucleotide-binding protein
MKISFAEDVTEARKELKENTFDGIIMDVRLPPGEDGRDNILTRGGSEAGLLLAKEIRRDFPDMPIIGFSVEYAGGDVARWFSSNAAGYIQKTPMSNNERTSKQIIDLLEGRKIMPRVFIIHGHDSMEKLQLKNYIQNTLNLGEPIILHEVASQGRTLIEKFEDETDEVDLVFALLTPDDKIATQNDSEEIKYRARQNVIFEIGYFYGKLKRKTAKLLLLHKGKLDIPSDIQGIVYIDISDGIIASGELIRKELKSLDII